MIGRVIAMEPREYERWLAGKSAGETPAQAGERLFTQYGCNTCHNETSAARGPSLVGLFGKQVQLQGGEAIIADENYIRQSVFEPTSQIVSGFPAIMPTFKGQLTEDDVMQIVAYIKSLSTKPTTTASTPTPAAPTTAATAVTQNSANTTSKAN
jgi:cytochrome c oxidase subunit 2